MGSATPDVVQMYLFIYHRMVQTQSNFYCCGQITTSVLPDKCHFKRFHPAGCVSKSRL